MKKGIAIIAVLAMIMTLFAVPVSAAVEPTPNYAFIPNALEASVSKVDLAAAVPTEVARYSTIEPRPGVYDLDKYRVSRLAIDSGGNAWALNTMTGQNFADYATAQGSVARISASPVEPDNTSITGGLAGIVTNDDRVSYHDLGDPGDGPRTITIVEEGGEVYLWIGFYLENYFQKYWYNEVTGELEVVGAPIDVGDYTPYSAVLDGDGIMWVVSRNASPYPSPVGVAGVFCFDTTNLGGGVTALPYDFPDKSGENPYAIVLGSDGRVWVSDGSNWSTNQTRYFAVYTYGSPTTVEYISSGMSQAMRGFMEDADGNIWATTINGLVLKGTKNNGGYIFETVFSGWGELAGIGMDNGGHIWVIRHGLDDMRRFDPGNIAAGFITVGLGNGPYAYDNFIVPPPPEYEICGMKVDADTQDGLEGWTIDLYKLDETLTTPAFVWLANDVTDVDGMYCFEGLLAGEYKVSEVLQDGWEQDLPIDNEHLVSLPDMASDCEDPETFYNFVNGELYSLCGIKYRSDTQMPLGGWMITLEKSDGVGGWDPVASKVTDINGAYCFEDLRAGVYRIAEVLKTGWTLTDPEIGYHEVMVPEDIGEPISFDFYNEPDMECYDDTIWAYGGEDGAYTDGSAANVVANNTVEGNTSNNWGWTNEITEPGLYVFTLYRGAGQNDLDKGTPVGTLTVDFDGEFAEVTYEVAEPYTLSEVHLWVGDTQLPEIAVKKKGVTTYTPTSAPGQLAKLGFSPEISTDGLSATITVEIDASFWVAAHGVVNWCEMIALPETTYYHWGVGYPYGATPETYATASVSTEGIMDVYWYGNGVWWHDIYHSSQPLTWPVQDLNPPVKMLHELYFPGVTLAHYSRVEVDLSLVPVPNAMSILIP